LRHRRIKNYDREALKVQEKQLEIQNRQVASSKLFTVLNIIVIVIFGVSNIILIIQNHSNDAQLKMDEINQTKMVENHQLCSEYPRIYIGEPFGINPSKFGLSGINIPFVDYNNPSQITNVEIILNNKSLYKKTDKIFNKNEYSNILIISDSSFDFSKYVSDKTIILPTNLNYSIDNNLKNNTLLIKLTYDGFTQKYQYHSNRMFYISLREGLNVIPIPQSTDIYMQEPIGVDESGNILWQTGKIVCE
jgi:hypothetical protein